MQLLELQGIDWLRIPLFQGFATSAVAGAEGLIRSTRSALIQKINSYPTEEHPERVTAIIQDLLLILNEKLPDDRYAIPILETSAFLLDGYVASAPQFRDPRSVSLIPLARHMQKVLTLPSLRKLFVLVQKAHFKTQNIVRLEAAIRAYAPLSRLEQVRVDVLKKLTGMLLHPFPRVCTTNIKHGVLLTGIRFGPRRRNTCSWKPTLTW